MINNGAMLLETAPARDFTSQIFSSAPAMVKKEPVNGLRIWTKYDPATFSDSEYEIVPGMWDHEHCSICWKKIQEGAPYWQNSQKHILCNACHDTFQRRCENRKWNRDSVSTLPGKRRISEEAIACVGKSPEPYFLPDFGSSPKWR
jgi:hypothetical protein